MSKIVKKSNFKKSHSAQKNKGGTLSDLQKLFYYLKTVKQLKGEGTLRGQKKLIEGLTMPKKPKGGPLVRFKRPPVVHLYARSLLVETSREN